MRKTFIFLKISWIIERVLIAISLSKKNMLLRFINFTCRVIISNVNLIFKLVKQK